MSDGLNLKYTLAFIRGGNQILMLNRGKSPNMGLWNGIGGKFQPEDEGDPMECILREIEEEAHWAVPLPRFAGVVTWNGAPETGAEGMYVYIADVNENDEAIGQCEQADEGVLAWFTPAWILDRKNYGVVDNIKHFLPPMLAGEEPVRHHCTYENGLLVKMEQMPLPAEVVEQTAHIEGARREMVAQFAADGGKRA